MPELEEIISYALAEAKARWTAGDNVLQEDIDFRLKMPSNTYIAKHIIKTLIDKGVIYDEGSNKS